MNFDGVYVMSEQTWDMLKETEFAFAKTQPDPIAYIAKTIAKLNVEIDEEMPLGLYAFIPDGGRD
jgi:hypothetical protein